MFFYDTGPWYRTFVQDLGTGSWYRILVPEWYPNKRKISNSHRPAISPPTQPYQHHRSHLVITKALSCNHLHKSHIAITTVTLQTKATDLKYCRHLYFLLRLIRYRYIKPPDFVPYLASWIRIRSALR